MRMRNLERERFLVRHERALAQARELIGDRDSEEIEELAVRAVHQARACDQIHALIRLHQAASFPPPIGESEYEAQLRQEGHYWMATLEMVGWRDDA